MAEGNESMFKSGLRTMFKVIFGLIGLAIGLLLFLFIMGLGSSKGSSTLEESNTVKMLYDANGKQEALKPDSPLILQLRIDGVIGLGSLKREKFRQKLFESREGDFKNDRVKALLLFINSPGGTVVDADAIYRFLNEYKEEYKVPVFAYVDGLCASGGYYIAVVADKIYASNVSVIGSVGVIVPTFMNFSKVLEKFDVSTLTLSAGKGKDALNPLKPWSPDEGKGLQEIIDHDYKRFVEIVTKHRPHISPELLTKEYGAEVFSAPKAEELGYIDGASRGYDSVLKELAHVAELHEGEYQVIELEQKSWLSDLFNSESALFTGKVEHVLRTPGDIDPSITGQALYLYQPN